MGFRDDPAGEYQPPRFKGQEVSLGCGTLILIALIVMFFSGRGTGEVKSEVRQLQREVRQLRDSVEQLQDTIERLENVPR